jgi:hypothetical protein
MTASLEPTTKYPYPVELPNSYEVPFRPKPGQVLLFVDIDRTEDPLNALKVLEAMGYKPDLRFCSYPSGRRSLCALLRFEQHNPFDAVPENYRSEAELEALWAEFPPPEGDIPLVTFSTGMPQKVAIAA